ncbi:Hint domain-containing protein [Methylosinus sp. RM1]|uniref:Hint domain-containing protein n=1 Tax=Methylosinus sp. RM1 TaxID=2583817 RepID=UPI00140AFC90|nr:Hint domain-containing protein [Methylosinus sp. RM1]
MTTYTLSFANLAVPGTGSNAGNTDTVSGQFTIDFTNNKLLASSLTIDGVDALSAVGGSGGNIGTFSDNEDGAYNVGMTNLGSDYNFVMYFTGQNPTALGRIIYQSANGRSFDTGTTSSNYYAPNNDLPAASAVACFCSGTHILTTRGNIPVEALVVGDLVVTASGATKPIRWLRHREIDCRNASAKIRPVRISAYALGPDRPARDLLVSPDHALCFDILGDALVPAGALVNGATITQPERDRVSYWHVELEGHDILLAENQPAESYIDTGNRAFFVESDVVSFDAEAVARAHAGFCRPFHASGPLVEALRAQLRARAEALGWTLDETPALDLHLLVDGVRIEPIVRGPACRFQIPAGAREARLSSSIARPVDVGQSDARELGVCVSSLTLCDGFGADRQIDLSDPRLDHCGFHALEEGARRWTSAQTILPAEYLRDCPDGTFLRVELCGPPVARWIAPASRETLPRQPFTIAMAKPSQPLEPTV